MHIFVVLNDYLQLYYVYGKMDAYHDNERKRRLIVVGLVLHHHYPCFHHHGPFSTTFKFPLQALLSHDAATKVVTFATLVVCFSAYIFFSHRNVFSAFVHPPHPSSTPATKVCYICNVTCLF
jgi:hypothetical protein